MISAEPFDFPYDGKLSASATALVVIDLQEDFLSNTGYFAKSGYDPSPLRAILPTVNRLPALPVCASSIRARVIAVTWRI